MYRVALIDDIEDQYEKYKIRLAKRDIELVFMDFIPDYEQIVEWLLNSRIEFVLIDYKLDTKYEFQGSQLMQYINNSIPDLQCVLFTSNTTDDDLVMDSLKVNKSVFNSNDEKYNKFIDMIKQGVKVFNNRKDNTLEEYIKLKAKKDEKGLTPIELDRMRKLYKFLVSYGLVEVLPDELIESNIEEKIDKLIKNVEEYIKQNKE